MKDPATVVIHPSSEATPDLVLMGVEEELWNIQALAVVMVTKDGRVSACHSTADSKDLSYMKVGFDRYVNDQLFEDGF
jgi:hypothetical protein